jgi:hypothetical protein
VKVIGWIVGIIILAVVGAGVYIVLNSGSIIKTAVETLGPQYLGVPVSLGSAEISLTEGSGALNNLKIGNPPGFSGPDSFKIGRVSLALDPSQISDQLVVIKSLSIDGAELAVIARGTVTNLQTIMKSLESGDSASQPTSETGSPIKLIIDKFTFTNAKTVLESDLLGSKEISLPDISLNGIGRNSSGVTAQEAVKQMLRPIIRSAQDALVKEGLGVDDLKKNAAEKIQEGIGKGLKGLTDRLQN